MNLLILEPEEMRNAGGIGHLEKALEAVPGVQSVEVDPLNKLARVEHDGTAINQLTRAAQLPGYAAHVRR